MAPQLTVGLIVRDDAEGLARSAACVFNQTWRGSRVLKVLEDGSTEETRALLARLEKQYGAIETLRSDRSTGSSTGSSTGIAQARNRILESTATPYLAWIDAGDVWHPRKLELGLRTLERSGGPSAIVACPAYWIDDEGDLDDARRSIRSADSGPGLMHAPFSTLLGETEAFLAVGRLDERLHLLADEEFVLRLALAGAERTLPAGTPALCGLKRRASGDPRRAAEEADTILSRHRTALAATRGRGSVRRYRCWLSAGRAGDTGKRAEARRAGETAPLEPAAPDAPASLRQPGAPALGAARRGAASYLRRLGAKLLAANPLDPAHPAVVAFTGLLTGQSPTRLAALAPGLAALTASNADDDVEGQSAPELSAVERSVLTVAHACCAAGKLGRAESLLDDHIAKSGARAHPRILERLAAVQLAAGRPERAEAVLAGALERYPDDPLLHLTLADALARRRSWREAIAHWERASERARTGTGIGLRTRIARAYRSIDKPAEALGVASAAATLGLPSAELERELTACLRLAAGWPDCLVPIHTSSAAAPGRVEDWGFLGGGSEPLKGSVTPDVAHAAEIRLCVNGLPTATTRAASITGAANIAEAAGVPEAASIAEAARAATDGGAPFAINCADLLYYLGDGDVIEIAAGQGRLELPVGGIAAMVHNGLPSRFASLRRKLEQGFVFTKVGRLKRGHSEDSKRAALDFYLEVSSFLKAQTGLPVFPFYGNLLGAIREHDFIAHDADGFDMMIVCRGGVPSEVKAELAEICRLLRERGYDLDPRPWCVYVRARPGKPPLLDLNYGWFNESGELNVAFGWRHAPVRGPDAVTAERSCRLMDRVVKVPGNAEAVLEQLYGPGWRVPEQGYSPLAGIKRDARYLLSDAEMAAMLGRAPASER